MLYLIISLINAIYGIMLLVRVTTETPGYFLIIFIGGIIAILGLVGFILWLWDVISSVKENNKSSRIALKDWFQIAKGIDILLILGLLFRAFVLQPFVVDGSSMEPNFHDKEYLLVNRLTFHTRAPNRGDTIIFRFPKDVQLDYIKRIVGLPGETVTIDKDQVLINGQLLEEPYMQDEEKVLSPFNEPLQQVLGPDQYFVMGDNRNHSSDSREWGPVPKANIIGRAWFVVYPTKNTGIIKNPAVQFQQTVTFYFNKVITSLSETWGKLS